MEENILNEYRKIEDDKINLLLTKITKTFDIKIKPTKREHGTYGYIYFAESNTEPPSQYVIKIFKDDISSADVLNEISCLSELEKYHLFPEIYCIVQIENGNYVAIIMDYCGEIIIPNSIKKFNPLLLSLDFLTSYNILYHEKIIHRDIKNNNLCINDNGYLSFIDFGYARKGPFISSDMELIAINKHIESLTFNYDYHYSEKIDLMSIFNVIVYLFNYQNDSNTSHFYPINIKTNLDQLKNIIYLLLSNNNTPLARKRIFNMVGKITKYEYFNDINEFDIIFEKSLLNEEIYKHYTKLINNIPHRLYKNLKKLLNINPKKRISFGSFFNKIMKDFPELFTFKKEEKKFSFPLFDKKINYSLKVSIPENLYITYTVKFHPKIYALSFYRYYKMKSYFVNYPPNKLMELILYINYVTMVENIEPERINASIDLDIISKYIKYCNGYLHGQNPYHFINKMRLFRWTDRNSLLFDYFLTIFSTNNIICFLQPYLICVLITILIAKLYRNISIEIDTTENFIYLPSTIIDPIPLTKNTLKLFLNNNNIRILMNKFYGYYAALVEMKIVLQQINSYYQLIDPNISSYINYYTIQTTKKTKVKQKY